MSILYDMEEGSWSMINQYRLENSIPEARRYIFDIMMIAMLTIR